MFSVEFICTGPVIASLPTWFVNGRVAVTKGNCYRLTIRRAAGINATATLTINGNHNCDTFIIYCRIYRDSRFSVLAQHYVENSRLVTLLLTESTRHKFFFLPLLFYMDFFQCSHKLLTLQSDLPQVNFLHQRGVHINERFSPSNIEWKPPYNSSVNNDIIRVDPHITHYHCIHY